ncbi:hypothetical protein [Paenibacillus sp. FSL R7-0331]|uniref:hypothetical protein n=1 Tax=Paenibacillus sp. FSL R7-0331 TaxID=1536773 RepID=UPI0004F7FD69|nr:hypothetical protein [Paenibacillus sp. FSL R7-0331]AIQ52874.1 hypothetical protein R70331_16000 [Paenibacillus sp. FSL R7-0331]
MIKKIGLIACAVTIISGVVLVSNLKADPYPEKVTVHKTDEHPVNTNFPTNNVKPAESVKIEESVESKLAKGYYSQLYTPHGMFLRADEQSIFKESEIARKLDQVGPNTNQLIFEGEFFLKVDESTFLENYPNSLLINETNENPTDADIPSSLSK